jgi:hypothetical protein
LAHVAGLSVLSLLYTAWAYVGYIATDKYAYYFFDHKKVGWEYVAAAIVAFVALASICKASFFQILDQPC